MALWLGITNWDPYSIYISTAGYPDILDNLVVKILRHIILHVQMQWLFLNGKAGTFVGVGMTIGMFGTLNRLKDASIITYEQLLKKIDRYRQVDLLVSLVEKNNNIVVGFVITVQYAMIIASACWTLYGYRNELKLLFGFAAASTVLIIYMTLLCFKIGSTCHETSCAALEGIDKQCKAWNGYKGLQLNKTVKSLRIVCVKAGSSAIVITRSLKQGFFEALLFDTIDMLLLTGSSGY